MQPARSGLLCHFLCLHAACAAQGVQRPPLCLLEVCPSLLGEQGAAALWVELLCTHYYLHGEAKLGGALCVNLDSGPGRKLFQKFLARDEGWDLCLGDEFASRGCGFCSDGLPLVLMSPLPGWAWQQPCCWGALVCQSLVQLPLQASTLRTGGGGPHGAALVQ